MKTHPILLESDFVFNKYYDPDPGQTIFAYNGFEGVVNNRTDGD